MGFSSLPKWVQGFFWLGLLLLIWIFVLAAAVNLADEFSH